MSNFEKFKTFVVPTEKESGSLLFKDFKHQFYPLQKDEIDSINLALLIPFELKEFYEKIGYGFFYKISSTGSDRILDPESFKMINLKEDYYEYDPDLEIYDSLYKGGKLLFYEINEGNYLAIDRDDINGKNAVYYFDNKIADSLEGFLLKYDSNPKLFDTE